MFKEKVQALKKRDEVIVHSQQLEVAIAQACSELPELQILGEVASTEKIQKLATVVKESKE